MGRAYKYELSVFDSALCSYITTATKKIALLCGVAGICRNTARRLKKQQGGRLLRFVYTSFQEIIHANTPQSYSAYSIQCRDGTSQGRVICCFHDVSLEAQFADSLARLCTETQLEPIHFADVFYDFSMQNSPYTVSTP